jgi:LuxR family maltose regulon positive regulatory protein
MPVAAAAVRLAQRDPATVTAVLAPVLDGPILRDGGPGWPTLSCRRRSPGDALGDPAAAGHALERALDLAEPDGALLWFLMHPAPGLLEWHWPAGHRSR